MSKLSIKNEIANEISELMINFESDSIINSIFEWNFYLTSNGWKTDITEDLLFSDESFYCFLFSMLTDLNTLESLEIISNSLEHLKFKERFIKF